jgi:hypothetical protein
MWSKNVIKHTYWMFSSLSLQSMWVLKEHDKSKKRWLMREIESAWTKHISRNSRQVKQFSSSKVSINTCENDLWSKLHLKIHSIKWQIELIHFNSIENVSRQKTRDFENVEIIISVNANIVQSSRSKISINDIKLWSIKNRKMQFKRSSIWLR